MKHDDVIRIITHLEQHLDEELYPDRKRDTAMRINVATGFGKYTFNRTWYQAGFNPRDYCEVDKWCEQQFGPHPAKPDAWSRWWHKFENSILFRDEKDYVLFMLRWS